MMTESGPVSAAVAFPRGSEPEKEAIGRFADFFAELNEENVRAKVDGTYAENAYLNDTLKEITGRDRIREYFLETARGVDSCKVELTDVAVSGSNYYVRWVMEIRFKKLKKGQACRSLGMSHLCFNAEGRVIYHRDYWDAAGGLFEHLPVVGTLIRMVKRRI